MWATHNRKREVMKVPIISLPLLNLNMQDQNLKHDRKEPLRLRT